MDVLKMGEKLIAKESDYTSGSLGWFGKGVNDAYDLYLVENSSKNLVLIIFMKIQFIFEDSNTLKWSRLDKQVFVSMFESAIKGKWGNNRLLKSLPSGKKVLLDFRFESLIDSWAISEHWEVHVKKIKKGGFSQSSVSHLHGNVSLDSEDIHFTHKGNGHSQRGIVHEFGHMLGLPDEYEVGTTHASDYSSIMNRGETVSSRHDAVYVNWLDKILKSKGIK